ncbi:hypothetical protein OF83DRAFT_1175108 [Amylostereum chailletii]|nr:hypothetical protein OF83DRAFT_1175108 [Amylostereum chailletii]
MYSLPALVNAFDTCEQWKYGHANEATQALPVVPLLNVVFRNREQKPFLRIAREVDIRLAKTGPTFPDKARLDFCTICASPLLVQTELVVIHKIPSDVLLDTRWQADPSSEQAISLMLFPGESLGLSPAENFDFVLVNGVMRIYGMEKRTDAEAPYCTFLDYQFATFDVRKPLDFLKFHSFLCKLAAYLDAGVLKGFFELTPEKLKLHLADRTAESWRAPNKSGHDQNPGWDGGGGAYIPFSPWDGDTYWETEDQPVAKRSFPLSVNNLKAHTKREGSVDILSHTGMSTSSQS